MPEGLRLAVTTLTVLPVRRTASVDRRTAGQAMALAPLVGLLLGSVAAGVAFATRQLGGGDLLAAALAIGTLALLTRGLHLDGLADVADGLASYRDPEGTRAVMKGPTIGPLGVVTLVLVLLVQVAALAACLQHHLGTVSLLTATTTARIAITAACRGVPAATASGLGAMVAGTVRRGLPAAWTAAAVLGFGLAEALDGDAAGSRPVRFALAACAVGIGLVVTALLRRHVTRRVGGLTGDVLGAVSEVASTLALVVLAVRA